jgi:flagellar protein FliO/FliZ
MMGPALRMFVSLGIVLALMYVAAMLLRRTHGGSAIRAASAGSGSAAKRPGRARGRGGRGGRSLGGGRGRGITMTSAVGSMASSFVSGSRGSAAGAAAGLTAEEVPGRRALRRNKARRRNRLEVLARQSLGKNASVAVVRVGNRTLIVGVTDMAVQLLSEVDASVFDDNDELALSAQSSESAQPLQAAQTAQGMPMRDFELAASGGSSASGVSVLDLLRERTVRRA